MTSSTNPAEMMLLDPDFASTLGQQVYGFTAGQAGVGLLGIASFLMFLFLLADGGAAIIRILYAIGLSSVSLEPSSATISTSKKIIRTTLLSLLGSFSLVLIMLAVNPDVVTGDVDLKGLWSSSSSTPQLVSQGRTPQKVITGSQSEDSLRETLVKNTNGKITVNNPPCTGGNTKGCTNLAGLPPETVQMLLRLVNLCSCSIVITGGTEPGHQTHGINKRPVDLRLVDGDALDLYIKNTSNKFGQRKGKGERTDPVTGKKIQVDIILCNQQYKPAFANFIFCDEPSNPEKPNGARHWHVS